MDKYLSGFYMIAAIGFLLVTVTAKGDFRYDLLACGLANIALSEIYRMRYNKKES